MPLGPGSIAFTGFNADGNDNLAFVALETIAAGTTIYFQDNEWDGAAFNTGEGAFSWTATAEIAAGTIVRIDDISVAGRSSNLGTVALESGAPNFSGTAEVVYAFVGTSATAPTSFLTAVANNTVASGGGSLANTGLTVGVNALELATLDADADIAAFNGARDSQSSFSNYAPVINNPANWVTQDAAGDQTADGTAPDAPFSDAGFTLQTTEAQTVQFAAGSLVVSQAEGEAGTVTTYTFTVERTGGTTGEVSFSGNVASSQANSADFAGTPTLPFAFSGTIADLAASTTVTVQVNGDAAVEANENFTLTLSSVANSDPDATTVIGSNSVATGTIVNDDLTEIGAIQGTGHLSGMVGQVVTTKGVVTAVDTNGSRGFYIQDADGDGNAATSDGIFVFLPSGALPTVGHLVTVTGTVSEFTPNGAATGSFSSTQVGLVTNITDLGVGPAIEATQIGGDGGLSPPTESLIAGGMFFESLEGMLVKVVDASSVGPTNDFGEIFTVVGEPTGQIDRGNLLITPGNDDFGDINTSGGDYNPERVQIDDDSGILPGFVTPDVNVGAELGDVTGILRYDFGNYEVIATQAYGVDQASTLVKETATLEGDADHLTVASYNAENLDPKLEDINLVQNRSASNVDDDLGTGKFDTIAAQIFNALKAPDILALQEIQDNDGAEITGTSSASQTLQILVDKINALADAAGSDAHYSFIDNTFIGNGTNGGQPGGNIRTAFIYRDDRVDFVEGSVRTIGADGSEVTTSYVDQQTNPDNPFFGSRPPLVATFLFNGEEVTVVDNHFTSKGGSAPLLGADQPPFNAGEVQRAAQAQAVNTFVDNLLAADPNANVIVAGDLNEHPFEEPMQVIKGTASISNYDVPGTDPFNAVADYTEGGTAVLQDLLDLLPEDQRFDYVFEGNSQTLDHVLATNGLMDGAEFDVVRLNAEFADQTSDHDPLIARFHIPSNHAPEITSPASVNVAENVALAATLTATDADNDAVTFALAGGADAGLFTLDANTGELRFIATPDFETPGDANGDNVYDVLVSVTDPDGAGDSQAIAVTVTNVAEPGVVKFGGLFNDSLAGGFGDDSLFGLTGNDSLVGNDGNDDLFAGWGDDRVVGGRGNDTAFGDTGNDRISGDLGNDRLSGENGNDSLDGGEGTDYVAGGDGNDVAGGGGGNDSVLGNDGNDSLTGGAGNDLVLGGSGRDRIEGGSGNDYLDGGSGNDLFVFHALFGNDVLADFQRRSDDIEFHDGLFTNFNDMKASSVQVGGDVRIMADDGSTLLLKSTTLASLQAGDFHFG